MRPSDRFRETACYVAGPVANTPMGPHVTAMRDARFALLDPRFTHDVRSWMPAGMPHSMAMDGLWSTEGEQHKLRRRLLHTLLSLQAATAMAPTFDRLTIAQIRKISKTGDTFNFASLAYSVTFRAVLAVIGLPRESVWLWKHLRTYERQASVGNVQPEAPEVRQYFIRQIHRRQAEQKQRGVKAKPHDLLEVLADAVTRQVISLQDACGDVMMFLAAGMGTTGTTAGNTFGLMHEKPRLAATLRARLDDEGHVDRFVLEALRFKTAFSHGPTTVLEQLTLPSGVTLKPGPATLCFSAANRDTTVFKNPHVYNPYREDLRESLGFGYGRHLCPGQHHGLIAARRIIIVAHRYMVGLRLDPSREWENKAAITDVVEHAPALHDSRATLAGLPQPRR